MNNKVYVRTKEGLYQSVASRTSPRVLTNISARLASVMLAFMAMFLCFTWRLTSMMIFCPEMTAMDTHGTPVVLSRGNIYDRNGTLIATNLITQSLYADPMIIPKKEEIARKLSEVISSLSYLDILKKISANRRFVWLKRNLTPREQIAVHRLGLPGLYFRKEESRVYPHGHLFSHIVGYTNTDNRGLAGIEKYFDEQLANPEQSLNISCDARLQYVLREELACAKKEYQAEGAVGVILNAHTGEVLAMVSLPDFDPNHPEQAKEGDRFNQASLGVYELGSIFKVLTAAMAFETGKITLETMYDTTKPIRVGRHTIHDYYSKNRSLSVPEVFIYSSNIATAQMALEVGGEEQRKYLTKLQLLSPLKFELPEVATPITPKKWKDVNVMTISYGHGIAVSPLQFTNAVATIVNGGLYHDMTLIKRKAHEMIPARRVFSQKTSYYMTTLMREVVLRGSGRSAQVEGYGVLGKTGTGEKPTRGGYKQYENISSFVCAFPEKEPSYVILVMFDAPNAFQKKRGVATGGRTAAPVAGKIIARIGPILGVPVFDRSIDNGRGVDGGVKLLKTEAVVKRFERVSF